MNILKKCRRALATLMAVGTAFVATAAWAATPLSAPTWTMHSVKNTEIKLEWSKVDNALNYTVYFKESTADKFRQYAVVATNSTTYYGVKNKSYDFYLVANPKAGKDLEKSAASETKTVLLNEEANPKEPLPTPTWTMHSVKNTEIKLEWSKVEDALNYTVYYKESTASKFQQLVVSTNSTTYYGVKNKSYDFFVVANPKYNDGNAVSAASETKTILLNEEANPKEPLPTPTWTMHSVKNTEIKLEWSKVEDALNYTVYYKESTASKFQQLVASTNSTTYYGIKNRTYDFFVVANPKYNDGNAASAASETKTILLNEEANPKEPLATPTWTNVSASKTKISLSWNEVDGALNYSLFYKEATAKNFVKLVIGKTSTTYYGIKGKTYEFYLVANPEYNNGYEVSAASETKTITLDGNNVVNPPVDPNPNPDAPDNPSNPPVNPDTPSMPENQKTPIAAPVLSAKVSGTTITVSWNDVDKARGYKVFWKVKGSSDKYQESNEIGEDIVSYKIIGVVGQTYDIYAIAYPYTNLVLDYTKSKPSEHIEATISKESTTLATPQNIKIEYKARLSETGMEGLIVTWDPVAGATHYKVNYRIGAHKSWGVATEGKTWIEIPMIPNWECQTFEVSIVAEQRIDNNTWSGEIVATSKESDSEKYVHWKENFEVPLAPIGIDSLYTGKSGTISYAFMFDWTGVYYVDKIIVAYQYKKTGASEWSETFYIMDDVNSTNTYIAEIVGLANNQTYDFRFAVCATETMRNQGFVTSDWTVWNNVKIYDSGYYNVLPTFSEYKSDDFGVGLW